MTNGIIMPHTGLETLITAAFEDRANINAETQGDIRRAVDSALRLLDSGKLRVAEKIEGKEGPDAWKVNQWLKKAVLLSFRLNDMSVIAGGPGGATWWDKVPSKFLGWGAGEHTAAGFRSVPGAVVRHSAFVAPGAILMPSFVNLGAYVDAGTMVDTWATVGSCAQIGKNVHLSGGVGIGGVLEPLQANPTIIEDDCFIGARSECSSAPRRRSSIAPPARSIWAMCRPIPSSSPAICRASRCRTERRDRRYIAR